mmetsp:Transcript_53790/g.144009  ORF Transcript_53790/g.144009 Transcript_53790/m.144009 type:complete len:388 (+) Transcript_53790:617-1780(+)
MEEDQGCAPLAASLDEVRGLERSLAEQHSVVGKDSNGIAFDVCPAADHRWTVPRFEFMKTRTINDACDNLTDVVGNVGALWNNSQHGLWIIQRRLRLLTVQNSSGNSGAEILDHFPTHPESCLLVWRQVVTGSRLCCVHHATTKTLLVTVLSRGGLDQRWSSEVDSAIALHDDRLITHCRRVRPSRSAHTANHRNLRDAHAAHPRLIVELLSTLNEESRQHTLVRQVPASFLILCRLHHRVQLGPATIDDIDARKPIIHGDVLCAQPLSVANWMCNATLDRGIGAEKHALPPTHEADSCDKPTAVNTSSIHLPPSQRGELHERGAFVADFRNAVANEVLATREVQIFRLLWPATLHDGKASLKLLAQAQVVFKAFLIDSVARLELRT